MSAPTPVIGVVVVAYRAEDFIADCLESLARSGDPALRVVVIDNASPDDTPGAVRDWARGARPFAEPADWPLASGPAAPRPRRFVEMNRAQSETAGVAEFGDVTLIHAGGNLGFAGGVNVGLRALGGHEEVGLYWVLNPDSVITPGAPAAFRAEAARRGRFSLIGGRILYYEHPELIQSDGGRMRWWPTYGSNANQGRRADAAKPPDPASLDYVSGANMLASRTFLERAGLLDDSWFLYLEEIDWALRRGDLPLGLAPDAVIYHRAGASIGSRGADRMESPLAVYFSARNHLRFAARWNPWRLPLAYAASWAVTLKKYVAAGAWAQAEAALRGLHALPPPRAVRAKLSEDIWRDLRRRPAR